MLSRSVTLGLSLFVGTLTLFVGTLSGCQNQGYAVTNGDPIPQICEYNVEAIKQRGCLAQTGSDPDAGVGIAPDGTEMMLPDGGVLKADYFYATCLQNHRVVASRCATEQRDLAKCMNKTFGQITDPVERTKAFQGTFQCPKADSVVSNGPGAGTKTVSLYTGNATMIEGTFCTVEITALNACTDKVPDYAP